MGWIRESGKEKYIKKKGEGEKESVAEKIERKRERAERNREKREAYSYDTIKDSFPNSS